MSGIAVPNLKTFFRDTGLVAAREAEVPDADWSGGMNLAGSNAPGVGINTGDYNPKAEDWPRLVTPGVSQNIGTDNGANNRITLDQGADINDHVDFVEALGPVAPGGDIILGVVNSTGSTLAAGDWVWGTRAIV